MASINTTPAQHMPAVSTAPEADAGIAEISGMGITAAASHPGEGRREAAPPDAAPKAPETGPAATYEEIPAQPATVPAQLATLQTTDGTSASRDFGSIERPASSRPSLSPYAPLNNVVPAGDCGCGNGKKSYVYSIGNLSYDLATEADRDAFRQLMPDQDLANEGQPPVLVPANPYDVRQLVPYLNDHPYESRNLIWTLNLDLTPIYAIEAEPAYAEDVYQVFRVALSNQALPPDDENYVSRVSIPGVLTSRTKRLFSGQVVPVVIAQPRGLYSWNETRLIDAVIQQLSAEHEGIDQNALRLTIRMLLDKVYYQFRNLGQTSADRALNYAGTNVFSFAEGLIGPPGAPAGGGLVGQGLLSARVIPGGGDTIYTIDTIIVSKSPYCRIDSDCWDVQITFFNPENNRNARCVYQLTYDVSKEMPVSLAPVHQFLVAPSVTLVSNG